MMVVDRIDLCIKGYRSNSGDRKMALDARDYARNEFEHVLKQRRKQIAPPLLKALEDAFNLGNVQEIVESNDMFGLPEQRREKIHRKRIGRLARSLGQMIATTASATQIAAADVRIGYERWKQTESFRTVARGYHRRRRGGVDWLEQRETAIARMA